MMNFCRLNLSTHKVVKICSTFTIYWSKTPHTHECTSTINPKNTIYLIKTQTGNIFLWVIWVHFADNTYIPLVVRSLMQDLFMLSFLLIRYPACCGIQPYVSSADNSRNHHRTDRHARKLRLHNADWWTRSVLAYGDIQFAYQHITVYIWCDYSFFSLN